MKCVKSSLSSVVKTEIILDIMQQNVLKMHEVTSRVSENIRMLYLKTFNDTNDIPKLDTKLFIKVVNDTCKELNLDKKYLTVPLQYYFTQFKTVVDNNIWMRYYGRLKKYVSVCSKCNKCRSIQAGARSFAS